MSTLENGSPLCEFKRVDSAADIPDDEAIECHRDAEAIFEIVWDGQVHAIQALCSTHREQLLENTAIEEIREKHMSSKDTVEREAIEDEVYRYIADCGSELSDEEVDVLMECADMLKDGVYADE